MDPVRLLGSHCVDADADGKRLVLVGTLAVVSVFSQKE